MDGGAAPAASRSRRDSPVAVSVPAIPSAPPTLTVPGDSFAPPVSISQPGTTSTSTMRRDAAPSIAAAAASGSATSAAPARSLSTLPMPSGAGAGLRRGTATAGGAARIPAVPPGFASTTGGPALGAAFFSTGATPLPRSLTHVGVGAGLSSMPFNSPSTAATFGDTAATSLQALQMLLQLQLAGGAGAGGVPAPLLAPPAGAVALAAPHIPGGPPHLAAGGVRMSEVGDGGSSIGRRSASAVAGAEASRLRRRIIPSYVAAGEPSGTRAGDGSASLRTGSPNHGSIGSRSATSLPPSPTALQPAFGTPLLTTDSSLGLPASAAGNGGGGDAAGSRRPSALSSAPAATAVPAGAGPERTGDVTWQSQTGEPQSARGASAGSSQRNGQRRVDVGGTAPAGEGGIVTSWSPREGQPLPALIPGVGSSADVQVRSGSGTSGSGIRVLSPRTVGGGTTVGGDGDDRSEVAETSSTVTQPAEPADGSAVPSPAAGAAEGMPQTMGAPDLEGGYDALADEPLPSETNETAPAGGHGGELAVAEGEEPEPADSDAAGPATFIYLRPDGSRFVHEAGIIAAFRTPNERGELPTVLVRLSVLGVKEIDTRTNTMTADIVLELVVQHWSLVGLTVGELWATRNSLFQQLVQIRCSNQLGDCSEEPWFGERDPASDIVTYRIRIKGAFSQSLDLSAFPFDTQACVVSVRASQDTEKVRLAVNPREASKLLKDRDTFLVGSEWRVMGEAMSPEEAVRAERLAGGAGRRPSELVIEEEALRGGDAVQQSIVDMQSGGERDEDGNLVDRGTEGDCLIALTARESLTSKAVSSTGKQYSTITFAFTVQRRAHYYLFNIFLILAIIVTLTGVAYGIPINDPGSRLQTLTTLLLAAVSFKYVVAKTIPRVSYLTSLDAFVWGGIVWVAVANVEVALAATFDKVAAVESQFLIALGVTWAAWNIWFLTQRWWRPWCASMPRCTRRCCRRVTWRTITCAYCCQCACDCCGCRVRPAAPAKASNFTPPTTPGSGSVRPLPVVEAHATPSPSKHRGQSMGAIVGGAGAGTGAGAMAAQPSQHPRPSMRTDTLTYIPPPLPDGAIPAPPPAPPVAHHGSGMRGIAQTRDLPVLAGAPAGSVRKGLLAPGYEAASAHMPHVRIGMSDGRYGSRDGSRASPFPTSDTDGLAGIMPSQLAATPTPLPLPPPRPPLLSPDNSMLAIASATSSPAAATPVLGRARREQSSGSSGKPPIHAVASSGSLGVGMDTLTPPHSASVGGDGGGIGLSMKGVADSEVDARSLATGSTTPPDVAGDGLGELPAPTRLKQVRTHARIAGTGHATPGRGGGGGGGGGPRGGGIGGSLAVQRQESMQFMAAPMTELPPVPVGAVPIAVAEARGGAMPAGRAVAAPALPRPLSFANPRGTPEAGATAGMRRGSDGGSA